MKKLFLSLCIVGLCGLGLSSCSDEAAEFVPSQQEEFSNAMTDDETKTKKP